MCDLRGLDDPVNLLSFECTIPVVPKIFLTSFASSIIVSSSWPNTYIEQTDF